MTCNIVFSMPQAKIKRKDFNSKPCEVTAWICAGALADGCKENSGGSLFAGKDCRIVSLGATISGKAAHVCLKLQYFLLTRAIALRMLADWPAAFEQTNSASLLLVVVMRQDIQHVIIFRQHLWSGNHESTEFPSQDTVESSLLSGSPDGYGCFASIQRDRHSCC